MTNSPSEVTDQQIIARLVEISEGVDVRFAGFVWQQVAFDLGVSEGRVLDVVETFLAWEMGRWDPDNGFELTPGLN